MAVARPAGGATTSVPLPTAWQLRASEIAARDDRVRALVADRHVALVQAHDWFGGLGPREDTLVGAVLELRLEPPASVDSVWPGYVCRDGRLRGVPLHVVAPAVARPVVGVDVINQRVILIEPGIEARATLDTIAGTLPFPPMGCDGDAD